jgi:hypothetical protein
MYLRDFKLPKPQMLRQRFERDCGVVVFGKLAGVAYEDVCRDLPDAHLGNVTVDCWVHWLEAKGFDVLKRQGCPSDIVPCAHLVAPVDDGRYCHWVYRDADGDIHDPASPFAAMPADDPRMRDLTCYSCKFLTISVTASLVSSV